MRTSRWATASAAAALAVGFTVAAQAPASANDVWHQAVGRGSDDACPMNGESENSAGWSPWAASWAQWANDAQGGWVCTRSALAHGTPQVFPNGLGCVADGRDEWSNFGGSWYILSGSAFYTDSACTNQNGYATTATVYAPPGFNALDLCQTIAPGTTSVDAGPWGTPYLYECLS